MPLPELNGFSFHAIDTFPADQPTGWLVDSRQTMALPVAHGLLFGDQADWPLDDLIAQKARQIHTDLTQQLPAYETFLRRKGRRAVYDPYACFQPFNEATKAFLPFVPLLRRHLRPGDLILNLWDRSGWMASLLAGLFPEQTILTNWEGDRDVLGYKGYAYWLTGPAAPANLRVLFGDLHKPLPLPDQSVALVVGLDVLHRFDQVHLMRELQRVVRPEGGLIFPHVHLSNAEPDPYFDRGGRQLHGWQYDRLFRNMVGSGDRQAFVFSEPGLFQFNERAAVDARRPLVSMPDSPDYNALIALLPTAWTTDSLQPFRQQDQPDWASCRLLINFLLAMNPATGRVRIDRQRFAGAVGHLLDRHPVYEQHLAAADGYELSADALVLLYWAARQHTLADIAQRMNRTPADLQPLVRELASRDIVQLVSVTEACHRRQHYLSFQEFQVPASDQTFASLWQRAVVQFANRPLLTQLDDGSAFSYADANLVVEQVRASLQRDGLRAGDQVFMQAPLHAEVLLLIWACWLEGLVVVPIGPELPAATVAEIAGHVQPALWLTTAGSQPGAWTASRILLIDPIDPADEPVGCQWFSDWLTEDEPAEAAGLVVSDAAVILFTSGSTGKPKGVTLTHGQLYRSARLVTETFGWESDDCFFAVGDADSMSGLRNAALAPLEVGASVAIPSPGQKKNAGLLADAIGQASATLLATGPSLLRQWVQLGRRLVPVLRSLRLVMSTGSALSSDLRTAFRLQFDTAVVNYYGLTETTGICLAEKPGTLSAEADSVGWPVGCLAQVVDETGQPMPVGEVGELRIYGENITQHPYSGPGRDAPSLVRDGWLYTGDLAVLNPDGSVSLRGRRSELIKNAFSEVVFPVEIENQLLAFPAVGDAAVLGYQHDDTERLAAFLTLRDGFAEAEVLALLPEFLLSRLGPRRLPAMFRVVDSLPRTPTGKIARQTLLQLL